MSMEIVVAVMVGATVMVFMAVFGAGGKPPQRDISHSLDRQRTYPGGDGPECPHCGGDSTFEYPCDEAGVRRYRCGFCLRGFTKRIPLRVEDPRSDDPSDDVSCADCGAYRTLIGPVDFDGEYSEGGDFVCRPCSKVRADA